MNASRLTALLCLLLLAFPAHAAAASPAAGLEGIVSANGRPISGATVTAAGRTARSDARGRFTFAPLQVAGTSELTTVTVRAPGYGQWTLAGARLVADDTLRITAELQRGRVNLTQPAPRTSRSSAPRAQSTTGSFGTIAATASNTTPPSTIRVYVTGSATCNPSASGSVRVVDFKYYVKHVLSNEWLSGWPRESLRAGAMAVKSYGWYQVNRGGKWPDLGADVMDSTCDQVYNPAVSYASTDAAVDATWGSRVTRNGAIHVCYYWAGTRNDGSDPRNDRMSQWGSEYWARRGRTWRWILPYYYDNIVISDAETTPADTTAPVVSGPGQRFPAFAALGTVSVPVTIAWAATDRSSGISSYQLQRSVNGGSYAALSLPSPTRTYVTHLLSPRDSHRYRVRATDRAGNVSAWSYGPTIRLGVYQETSGAIAWTGAWTRQALSSAYGGGVRYATASSARAKISFTGRSVAWVSPRANNRGQARVYVDGAYLFAVDLYAGPYEPRRIVFQRRWSTSGAHTLEIRPVGTSGRPRIDIDAVVVIR